MKKKNNLNKAGDITKKLSKLLSIKVITTKQKTKKEKSTDYEDYKITETSPQENDTDWDDSADELNSEGDKSE